MSIYGIPGVGSLMIGAEDEFNQTLGDIGPWYDIRPFDYTRINPKRDFIATDGQLHNDVGPGGGFAGLHQQVEGSLSLWAHPSGVAVTTLASASPFASYLNVVFGGFGMPQEGCNGEPVGVSYDSVTQTIVLPNGTAADYAAGALIVCTDSGDSKSAAFITDVQQDGPSVILHLDRDIDAADLQGFTGGFVYRCDSGNLARLSTQTVGGQLTTFAVDQLGIGQGDRNQFSGCAGTKLSLGVDKDNRLMLTAGFKTHRAADTVSEVSADTTWPEPAFLQVHNWDVCINGESISNVASVQFECEYTLQPIADVCGDQGRSGFIVTGIKPLLKITALNDKTWVDANSWFENATQLCIGIVFKGEQTPRSGEIMGLWMPNARLTDPHNVGDGDLQFRSLEFVGCHGSVQHSGETASLGNFAIAFG